MKALFRKYRSVLRFLGLFLGTYIILSLLYGGYLKRSKEVGMTPDYITLLVAKQSEALLNGWGYKAQVVAAEDRPSMQLWVEGIQVGNIIEGCNSLSIIILFIAFIIAFAAHWKKTLWFLLAGSVLIYAVNVLRIAILGGALYAYPAHEMVLHTVVFPGIIYGMVFLLWILWIRSLYVKN